MCFGNVGVCGGVIISGDICVYGDVVMWVSVGVFGGVSVFMSRCFDVFVIGCAVGVVCGFLSFVIFDTFLIFPRNSALSLYLNIPHFVTSPNSLSMLHFSSDMLSMLSTSNRLYIIVGNTFSVFDFDFPFRISTKLKF